MSRRAGIASMLAWASGALFALQSASAEPFSLIAPAERGHWGPLVLAVIDQNRARPTGQGYCPEGDGPDAICIDYSIVEGSSETIRYLSRRPDGWRDPGRFPRIRFVGGHAVRWVDAGRQFALLEQTPGGYFWRVWSTSAEDDEVCLPMTLLERFRINLRLPSSAAGSGQERCFRLSAIEP